MQCKKENLIKSYKTPPKIVTDQVSKSCLTIYFDGSCALCSAEINHYASRVGGNELGFIDVSTDGAEIGDGLTSYAAMRRFHVRKSDGSLISGARAFVEVWDTLPGWRWAARLAKIPGVIQVLEIAYRAFLPIRPFISIAVRRIRGSKENA
jgi:predicted DCC family thiol-disulfide oxidoreductase YuxK